MLIWCADDAVVPCTPGVTCWDVSLTRTPRDEAVVAGVLDVGGGLGGSMRSKGISVGGAAAGGAGRLVPADADGAGAGGAGRLVPADEDGASGGGVGDGVGAGDRPLSASATFLATLFILLFLCTCIQPSVMP